MGGNGRLNTESLRTEKPEPGGEARVVEGEDGSNRGRDVDDLTFQILQERAFRAPYPLQGLRECRGCRETRPHDGKSKASTMEREWGKTASPLLSLQAGADGSSCFISLLSNRFFFLNYGGREGEGPRLAPGPAL